MVSGNSSGPAVAPPGITLDNAVAVINIDDAGVANDPHNMPSRFTKAIRRSSSEMERNAVVGAHVFLLQTHTKNDHPFGRFFGHMPAGFRNSEA